MTRNEVADFLREFANALDDRPVSERLRSDRRIAGARDEDAGRTEVRSHEEGTERYDNPDLDDPRSDERVDDPRSDERLDDPRSEERLDDPDERIDRTDRDVDDIKRVTLVIGGESATVSVPEMIEFDIKVTSKSPMFSSSVNQEVDFDLSWKVENLEDQERTIDVV